MSFRATLLVVVFYAVVPLVQVLTYLSGLPFADPIDVAAYAASITAFHWMTANVLLGLKLPFLQELLPYDLRIRLHVWSTLGLVVFLAWHAVYTIVVKAMLIDGVSWTLMALFGALVLLSAVWIPLPGLRGLRSRLTVAAQGAWQGSYEILKSSHKVLFLVLAALTYVHLLQSHLLGLVPPISAWGYHLLFAAAAGLFVTTRVRNRLLPALKVLEVNEQGGIFRLTLATHPQLRYRAGQFAFLRFDHPQLKGEEHPFSFTTAPHEGRVGFAIRSLGDFTSRLGSLAAGDLVRINGGFGHFHPSRGPRPLALIGSGIGAAPLIGILKDLAFRDPQREILCLLAVGRRDELLEPDQYEALRGALPNLTLRVLVFEEDGLLYGPELLAAELGTPGRFDYYLCSSEKVRIVVVSALRGLGVPSRRLHFEAFNLG